MDFGCEGCKGKKLDKLINKLFSILNRLTNETYLTVRITRLSNELLETLEMLGNCTSCKDEIGVYYYYESNIRIINEIGDLLDELEEEGGIQGRAKRLNLFIKLNNIWVGFYFLLLDIK